MSDIDAYLLKFIKKEKVTNDAYTFYFTKPKNLTFEPGQYLKVKLDLENPDARGISRYFTIASAPYEKEIRITTRIIKSTFKKSFFNISSGEKIEVRGPYGYMTVDPHDKKHIMISMGTALTPFRSMILDMISKKNKSQIVLFAFFEKPEHKLFEGEFKKIEKENKNIKIYYMDLTAKSVSVIVKENVVNYKDWVYYIAGPESFVSKTNAFIERLGVKKELIKIEDFPGL